MRHRLTLLCGLLATPFLGSCFLQQLDSSASSQTAAVQTAPRGPTKVLDTPPIELDFEGKRTTTDPCVATREQAAEILTTYCAGCHGGRTPAEKHGDFNTILDTTALLMEVSSTVNNPENPMMKMRLLVPGNPDASRIYLRVSHGEMPPPAMLGLPPNPTPTISDISVLRESITNCIAPTKPPPATGDSDGGPPTEIPPPANPDAGPSIGGQPDAEAPPPSADGGAPPPVKPDAGPPPTVMNCGLIGQACCAMNTCTAPGSRCGGATCEACGANTQLCCANRVCNAGNECVLNNNRGGTCEICGGANQRCCGNGNIATMTCTAGLVCRLVGQIARCQ